MAGFREASGDLRLEGVTKTFGDFTAVDGIDLVVPRGSFFALLGPSGCGKTTTLRMIAGLEQPTAGRVTIGDTDLTGSRPYERPVNTVFQSYALFPHLTIRDNVAFGPKRRKAADAAERADDALELVQMTSFAGRKPAQLSGGQQQRVALARAIVRQPKLFLLDEPLSNLDAQLRLETRLGLHKLQRSLGATTVYVTHDQEEAMTLADRIAVFMEGRIVQVGTPREIFATPQTVEVAGFIGTPPMNLLRGTLQGGAVTVAGSRLPVAGAPASAPAAVIAGSAAREVTLGVRPGDLRIASIGLPARVERVEDLGDSSIVSFVAAGDQLLKAKSDRMPTVTEGEHVYLGFDPQAAHLFDTQSGTRLGAGAAPSMKEGTK